MSRAEVPERESYSFIPNVPVNMSEYCRLEGGHILPGELALCAVSTDIIPDPSSCFAGPNTSFWVDGMGCISNMVNSCLDLPAYHSWKYEGDDIVCTYDFSSNMCAQPEIRPGQPKQPNQPPPAERSADEKNNAPAGTKGNAPSR
jgi:hypothetical protein